MPTIVEDVNSRGWAKPICVNDWGSEAYYLRATKSDAGTWGHSEQDDSVCLKEGTVVLVLWPDCTVSLEIIRTERVNSTVFDVGHEYRTSSDRPFIEKLLNGLLLRVPINDLRFKIQAQRPSK